MTDFEDFEDQDAQTERVLSNFAVLSFVARQWRRRPWLFSLVVSFSALATLADVFIPVAAGQLIDTISGANATRPARATGPRSPCSWASPFW